MNIFEKVGTPFARACENKMYEKIAKGVSKHEERAKKIQSGNMRKSSDLLHSDNTINGYCALCAMDGGEASGMSSFGYGT